ncbi:protein ALP1-like [Ooceraea biroi]|uniref:protein ALP1-like n=1 Tax=Ooceraea biroi TaxID=2015173 RepID=UPI0005B850AD|nr:protein ALP1-like [Ooceraea biroi]
MTRLTVKQFEELLNLSKSMLEKNSRREFLDPKFRLAFTVCFLASGDSFSSMVRYWRIGKSTSYKVVIETCNAIWQCLRGIYLKPPSQEEWENIEKGFYNRWDFPNCVGALDGKHIRVQCPPNSDSAYYNYKGYYSMVLVATCDANYVFTFIDIGDYGSLSDTSILSASAFGQALERNELDLPTPKSLPNSTVVAHHYFVGDEIFPLRLNLLRPYARKNLLGIAQKVFNYRFSRARRVIENAFGILTTRWRVLRTTLALYPDNVELIICATVCLHNFIMKREHVAGFQSYCPPGYVDYYDDNGNIVLGLWRDENIPVCVTRLNRVGSNRAATIAIKQQDT